MEIFQQCLLLHQFFWCVFNEEERFAIEFIDVLQIPDKKKNIAVRSWRNYDYIYWKGEENEKNEDHERGSDDTILIEKVNL